MAAAKLDAITQSLVDEFVTSEGLTDLGLAERFERFANFSAISSEHSDTFDVEDVSGPGDEVGIDGLAVLVNGALVTAPEQVDDLAERNGYLEAAFIFVSAKRSARFAEAEVATSQWQSPISSAMRNFRERHLSTSTWKSRMRSTEVVRSSPEVGPLPGDALTGSRGLPRAPNLRDAVLRLARPAAAGRSRAFRRQGGARRRA